MQKTLLAERTSVTHKKNRRRGLWVVVARTAYVVLTGTTIFLFVFSLPVYYTQMQIICPTLPGCSFTGQVSRGTLPWLHSVHLSVTTYAASFLSLATLHALLSLLIGIVIVWRLWGKSNELLGLLTSFVLILGEQSPTRAVTLRTSLPPVLSSSTLWEPSAFFSTGLR